MYKPIKGYEDLYKINEYGEVISLARQRGSVLGKDRILKPDNNKGYHRVTLSRNYKTKKMLVHRLVYETFVGEIKEGMVINHLDENTQNNHISNLEQCTLRENNHHSRKKLGYKLFEEDVIKIRNSELTTRELSEIYNVGMNQISKIKRMAQWKV